MKLEFLDVHRRLPLIDRINSYRSLIARGIVKDPVTDLAELKAALQAGKFEVLTPLLTQSNLDHNWEKEFRHDLLHLLATEAQQNPKFLAWLVHHDRTQSWLTYIKGYQMTVNTALDSSSAIETFSTNLLDYLEWQGNIWLNAFIIETLLRQNQFEVAAELLRSIQLNMHERDKLRARFVIELLRINQVEKLISLVGGQSWQLEFDDSEESFLYRPETLSPLAWLITATVEIWRRSTPGTALISLQKLLTAAKVMIELAEKNSQPIVDDDAGKLHQFLKSRNNRDSVDYQKGIRLFTDHIGRFPTKEELAAIYYYATISVSPADLDRVVSQLNTEQHPSFVYHGPTAPFLPTVQRYLDLDKHLIDAAVLKNLPVAMEETKAAVLAATQIVYAGAPSVDINKQSLRFALESTLSQSNALALALAVAAFPPFLAAFRATYQTIGELVFQFDELVTSYHLTSVSHHQADIAELVELKVITNVDSLRYLESADYDMLELWAAKGDRAKKVLRTMLARNPKAVPSFLSTYGDKWHPLLNSPRYIKARGENCDEFLLASYELGTFTPMLYDFWLQKLTAGDVERRQFVADLAQLRKRIILVENTESYIRRFIKKHGLATDSGQISEVAIELIAVAIGISMEEVTRGDQLDEVRQFASLDRTTQYFPNQRIIQRQITTPLFEAKVTDEAKRNQLGADRAKVDDHERSAKLHHTPVVAKRIDQLIFELQRRLPNQIENNYRYLRLVENSYNWIRKDGTLAIEARDFLSRDQKVAIPFDSIRLKFFARWRNEVHGIFKKTETGKRTLKVKGVTTGSTLSYFAKHAVEICTEDNVDLYRESRHLDIYADDETNGVKIIGNNQLFVLDYGVPGSQKKGRVLLIRGINQTDILADETGSEQYVETVLDMVRTLAQKNNYDGVILCPHTDWHPDSNRATNIDYLNSIRVKLKKVAFESELDVAGGQETIDHGHWLWVRTPALAKVEQVTLNNILSQSKDQPESEM